MKPYLVEKSTLWDMLGIIVFKIILDYSYVSFVEPEFNDLGFILDFSVIKYGIGWIAYLLLFMLLNRHKDHVLYMTLIISFLLLIVPSITLFSFRNEPFIFFYSIILPYAGMLLVVTTKRIRLYYLPYGKHIAIGFSALFVFVVLYHYVRTVGFEHINFNLNEVYELRKSDRAIASNGGIFGYLNPWVTKVFNIFLIAVALLYRKYLVVALFVVIQILLFGFSGHKVVLFSLVLLLGLYFINKVKHHSTIIIYSAVGMIGIALIYFSILDELMLPSILIRRAFFVPSDLNYIYFDYFSSHGFLYWSNSIFKNIFDYPYQVSPVFVIGDHLGFPEMAANTGVLGSGYMHLGIIGMIVYLFVVAILINVVHQFNKLPYWVVNAVVLMPFITIFISSDLPTALLTHGLFISVIILYLYSSSDQKTKVSTQ